jgi:ferrous iron transport protein B
MGDVARLRELLPQISPPQQGKPVPFASIYAQGSGELTRVEKILYNRYCALFCFILSVVLMFFLAFAPYMPGALLKGLLEEAICVRLAHAVSGVVKSTLVQSLLCEGVLSGVGGVLSFVPQIAILYLFLTLLEESGVMSALSFATDGIFQKVNLSGRAAFSLVSGFGCTAAAITTTKGYFSKGAQRRTIAVLAFIPCSAKMPVFLTFLSPLFANPFPVLCALYFGGILLAVVASKLLGGESEELLSEVTPIGIPAIKPCLIKLLFYVKGFIIKVVTTVFVFCLFSWFLAHFNFLMRPCALDGSMLASISKLLLPLFRPIGITDWQISYALLTGLIAKENIAATIAMLLPQGAGLTVRSAVAICVFVLACPACIAAFASSRKEVGLKFTLTYTIIQLITAFALSYAVYFIWGFFL